MKLCNACGNIIFMAQKDDVWCENEEYIGFCINCLMHVEEWRVHEND